MPQSAEEAAKMQEYTVEADLTSPTVIRLKFQEQEGDADSEQSACVQRLVIRTADDARC